MDYTMLTADKNTAGSVARWMNNSTIQGDVPEIIVEAQGWVQTRLRHWRMFPPVVTGNFVTGQPYITPPADFLEPAMLLTTGNYFQVMPLKPYQEVIMNWSYNGQGQRVQQQPLMYYFDNTYLQFDSPPDQNYAYAFLYFQTIPVLSSNAPTNFLTQYYPRLMRAALMAAASEWAKDSGVGNYDRTYWDQIAEVEIEKAQAESDRARRSIEAGMVLQGGGVSSNFPAYVTGWGGA